MSRNKKDLYYGAQLALPMLFYVIAFISPMFIGLVVDVSATDYLSTTVKLIILGVASFYLIPYVIGIPSREGGVVNLISIGLVKSKVTLSSIGLGILLGVISLGFMLLGSIIAGGYSFDIHTIDPKHIYFSFVPGIFEEIIFRGFIMIVLIRTYKSIKKAAAFQVFLFTLSHVKDLSFYGLLDVLTVAVIAIALTYVVYRTGHLFTAIIFHLIHDAFLFVVQKPGGIYEGLLENLIFYVAVWIGMVVIMIVTRLLTEQNNMHIYTRESIL